VAESFLALWRSKDQIHSEIHIRNFLFITVRNKAINLLAAQKRQASLLEKWNATQDPTDQSLTTEMVETEMLDLLQQAIKTLPTECKRIFQLSYHAEHTPAEIARLLHMNPATVRSQKRRAIQLIQQWIRNNTPPSSTLIAALGTTLHFLNKFFTILCTLALLICN
jgi:RNA polymerase sigma-70 factor (ECF subfamily)